MSLIDEAKKQQSKSEDGVLSEFIIDGVEVRLRTSYPLEEYFDITDLVNNIDRRDLRTQVPVFMKMVEGWGFDGDPNDPASYNKLDIFKVLMPLSEMVQRYVSSCMDASLKNYGGVSGTMRQALRQAS